MATFRILSFHLQSNWVDDLTREALRQLHPDLDVLKEEIDSYMDDFFHHTAPVLDDDDLIKAGMFSEESLVERFRKAAETVE